MAMVSVKIGDLSGLTLDWAAAKCECVPFADNPGMFSRLHAAGINHFSSVWNLAGPIIERELLMVEPWFVCAGPAHPLGHWRWKAYVLGPDNEDDAHEMQGETPLIAAMRCYVAGKTEGDSVMIPEELI